MFNIITFNVEKEKRYDVIYELYIPGGELIWDETIYKTNLLCKAKHHFEKKLKKNKYLKNNIISRTLIYDNHKHKAILSCKYYKE